MSIELQKQRQTRWPSWQHLSIPEGKNHSIGVTRRRLLVPIPEALPKSKEVCSVEVAKEASEYWRITFLDFPKRGRLPNDPSKKVEVNRQATKFVVLECVIYRRSLDACYFNVSES